MDILEILKDYGLPIATGVGGWWAGRPREKAEIDTTNVDNAKKLYDEWEGIADRERQRSKEHENTISELRGVISTLEGTVSALNLAIESLKSDNHSCKVALNKIMVERDILQNEVIKLREILERKEHETSTDLNLDINLDLPLN